MHREDQAAERPEHGGQARHAEGQYLPARRRTRSPIDGTMLSPAALPCVRGCRRSTRDARRPSISSSGLKDDPVRQGRHRHPFDVVGDHVVAAAEHRHRPRHPHQGDRAARPHADPQARPGAGCPHDAHRVVDHPFVDRHGRHRLLGGHHHLRARHLGHLRDVELVADLAGGHPLHQLELLGGVRIVDHDLQQEAVELGLGQRIGAFVLDRILGGQGHEGRRQLVGAAVDGDLLLLHHLEQGRLGLGRGAVDLVGQQQVGEGRAAAQPQLAGAGVVDGVAHHVGRHHVGGELEPREAAAEGPREGQHQQGLADPRHPFEQGVAAGQEGGQHVFDHLLLADHGALHLLAQPLGEADGLRQAERRRAAPRAAAGGGGFGRADCWAS